MRILLLVAGACVLRLSLEKDVKPRLSKAPLLRVHVLLVRLDVHMEIYAFPLSSVLRAGYILNIGARRDDFFSELIPG